MSRQEQLFAGFESHYVQTGGGRIFLRRSGEGPPVLLLHGYPQTHVMWHLMAPTLARRFTVIAADLPGYGLSDVPATDDQHTLFSKRAMGQAFVEVMHQLGHERFCVVGHDRGGRVAYRLALDHPERLTRVAVLDILPTYDYWNGIDRRSALKIFHWTFLAQPQPIPEMLLSNSVKEFFGAVFAEGFDPRAVEHYMNALRDPNRIHAICEDYRAGAYIDFEHDQADRLAGRKIAVPLLALWGTRGIAAGAAEPLRTWSTWATNVSGGAVEAGHFLCEENAPDALEALTPFLEALHHADR